MSKRLIIIDVSNFIFRAFFAIRPLTAPDGTPVNAVHGVYSMLAKMITDYKPTHILVARDTAGGTFRNELYSEYKANRGDPPEDLVPQFSLIEKLLEKMKLPTVSDDQFEADDLIGSACVQWKDEFDEILIASGDKDLMQFVDGPVKMLDTMKDKIYGPEDVIDKMGVRPDQIVDYLSMVGDSSDNVPGMKGIGAKGAAKLLEEYGTLENCIKHKDEMKGKKLINAFENHVEDALLSKKLIEIVTTLNLSLSPEATAYEFRPDDELVEYLRSLGFKSALKKIEEIRLKQAKADPLELPEFIKNAAENESPMERILIATEVAFKTELEKIDAVAALAVHTEYDCEDMIDKQIVGIGLSYDGFRGVYFAFRDPNSELTDRHLDQLLQKVWGVDHREVCSAHQKQDMSYALLHGLSIKAPTFDITQVHYNLSSSGRHDLKSMADEFLNVSLKDSGLKKDQSLNIIGLDEATEVGAEKACVIYRLAEVFKMRLKELELEEIYYQIDDPMIPILSKMEIEGISLDKEVLGTLEAELSIELEKIEKEISDIVGVGINLNSPKQVGELLFEKLNLPIIKKTKTGFSTDVEVLEELAAMNVSDVPALMIQYRELGKILSTYVRALPALVHPKTGRIHTSFHQHVAQTGRLSSQNPNLQNIPVRSELGRKVRKAFVAKKDHVLFAADYSQVELRLLAHFSEDPTMVEAFVNNQDVHAQTASEVLGLPLDKVTSADRSKAKAVNFGLMYGQSSFGLSKALRIPRKEAMEYITRYFTRFSKVKKYLDSLKEECEARGYAITLHGRKRLLPDIHSQNRTVKAQAERMAVNSPIQGTAADIIKLAMIAIDKKFLEEGLAAKMLLQVHDELIFEVPHHELEQVRKIVTTLMEGVVKLRVPLKVDVGEASNWYELKD
jgi:DNA polymerase I